MAKQPGNGITVHLKKFLFSGLIIVAFIFYAIYERVGGNTAPAIAVGGMANNPPTASSQNYKDGQYTGNATDAYYGMVQVRAVVSGGKITDVVFLNYPQDRRTSVLINQQAMPILKSEAITAQSASVNIVSGATDTSSAFISSLASALNQAL
jgi:uncharacterized protein with FMN-binding domain